MGVPPSLQVEKFMNHPKFAKDNKVGINYYLHLQIIYFCMSILFSYLWKPEVHEVPEVTVAKYKALMP